MSNNFDKKIKKVLNYFSMADADIDRPCIIVNCFLSPELKARFFEMGLIPDTEIVVLKKAPLGDPLEISARGYSLCLRAAEASAFEVAYLPDRDVLK